ncbi:hypothetical protein PAAG_12590 [Paracoccidioides lutzii Pb01]|uniref:Uncharacterized protein n=1 Tax=Paracoccidioides lutzii (strain ATCC MYA-826 / Pb01) TaxID=502779 RepID=A0A0A2V312_PARBA|nr:hypothetical protein PAAG_12590 [Paracoccidioides lutzii Pb01]KGQ00747.1 hypothetical protein PAAG_12590 [Paracoccidioides lutzii Pb01]
MAIRFAYHFCRIYTCNLTCPLETHEMRDSLAYYISDSNKRQKVEREGQIIFYGPFVPQSKWSCLGGIFARMQIMGRLRGPLGTEDVGEKTNNENVYVFCLSPNVVVSMFNGVSVGSERRYIAVDSIRFTSSSLH